jgi:hypothetical protein
LTSADNKNSEEKKADGKIKKKEQSVLQSKLTKLAIQIGYAGKGSCVTDNVEWLVDFDLFLTIC